MGWAVVLAIFVCVALFLVLHLRPLTDDEVIALAARRRDNAIGSYYSFDRREYTVDLEFKKRMPAGGAFRCISLRLSDFPAYAAGLLKYKKHEWIIVAFERNRSVELTWMNKGDDASQVHCGISMLLLQAAAANDSCGSILVFHNHPNPDPSRYSFHNASDQDEKSANALASELRTRGLNLLEFVCERGRHYEYWRSVCDMFLPLHTFKEDIDRMNGRSRVQNLSFHLERFGL